MNNKKFRLWALLILVAVVAVDQLTKFFAVEYLMPVGKINVIPGVLNFTYVENPGAVGGIFASSPWVFNIITVVVVVAIITAAVMGKFDRSKFLFTAVALICGGGIGNLIDRFFRISADGTHFVVDFIDVIFIPIWKLVFNIADSAVVIGCIMVIIYCIFGIVKEGKKRGE